MKNRVYLAGPDVFHPDYASLFAARKAICRAHGLEPLVPIDNDAKTASDIYRANVDLLDSSDAVVANITPFRGPHCDVGTAWEMGYGVAKGLPVFAYSTTQEPLASRVARRSPSATTDVDGMAIEPFGLMENLMIVEGLCGYQVHPSFESAVAAAARRLLRPANA
jgi:nucleoside 2-deoxyribosyltransferase